MRFQQGEIAIFAVARVAHAIPHTGKEVTVAVVGPFAPGAVADWKGRRLRTSRPADYLIVHQDGHPGLVMDWQLRKINPPEEPASFTRRKEMTA
jgi:hypothetical protein